MKIDKRIDVLLTLLQVLVFFILSILMKSYSIFFVGVIIVFIIALLIRGKDKITKRNIHIAFFFGIIFISLMYYANILETGSQYYIGGSDDIYFENFANQYNQLKTNFFDFYFNYSWDSETSKQSALYIFIIAKVIKLCDLVGGYHTFVFKELNLFFYLIMLLILDNLMKKELCFSLNIRKMLLLLMALFPFAYYMCSYTFRDILSALLMLIVFYSGTIIRKKKSKKEMVMWLIFAVIAILCQYAVRTFAAYISISILFFHVVTLIPSKIRLIAIIGMSIAFLSIFGNEINEIYLKGTNLLDYYMDYRANDNVMDLIKHLATVPLVPFGIILRVLYGFILPNPSFIYLFSSNSLLFGIMMTIMGLGTLFILFQLPYLLRSFVNFDLLSLTFSITLIVFVSTMTSRHLILVYPYIFLLIGKGKSLGLPVRKDLYFLYCGLVVAVYFINSLLL